MKKFLSLVSILTLCTNYTAQADWTIDCQGQNITLAPSTGTLAAERAIFITHFSTAYKNIPLEALKVQDLTEFLNIFFQREENDFVNHRPDTFYVSAKDGQGRVVGCAAFDRLPDHIYIRFSAVDPSLWQSGLEEALVFSVLNKYPDCRCLKLVIRKVNQHGASACRKLGFKQSDYVHAGLSPELYVGYELAFDTPFVAQTQSRYHTVA